MLTIVNGMHCQKKGEYATIGISTKGDVFVKKYSVEAGCCFCQECQYACPVGAVTMDSKGAHIDQEKCIGCGQCYKNCASEAIVEVKS